jgi:hypothetical protein
MQYGLFHEKQNTFSTAENEWKVSDSLLILNATAL